ncbi:hypothetical protein M9H77_29816 [Catharanthus roseus]|uniref:Uncharacterized protein n=1 Tax=Catharanthus roseus TaxID=4058 RepID=A0ACB9ZVU2_CATRO|nr:hypothetical protein M9H77_29816 [Catharanthus roseus]
MVMTHNHCALSSTPALPRTMISSSTVTQRTIISSSTGCIRSLFYWNSSKKLDIAHEPNYITYRTGKENIKISRYESQYLECSNDDEGAFVLREMRYLWTIPADLSKEGIHILVEFEPIEQQNIPTTHDRNTTTLHEHIMVVTQMISDEPFMLYSTVNNDDDEVDGSDGDDAVSNMGSGSPIDDIMEFGTVRLLDWNDSMTDIQLDMRFVDKVQTVSAVRKYCQCGA